MNNKFIKFIIGFSVSSMCTIIFSGASKTGLALSVVVGLIGGLMYSKFGTMIG